MSAAGVVFPRYKGIHYPPPGPAREAPALAPARRGGVLRRVLLKAKKIYWPLSFGDGAGRKRALDMTVAFLMLVALSPLFVLVALLIKLTDGGPVLFWQRRVGRHGREFAFPKFRSMVVDAERLKQSLLAHNHHGDCVTFKMRRDPRVTWIGRIIRKLSIDELPQLWCVLVGDMSLVGPRPPLPCEVARYAPEQRRRLDATPGLTCLWHVSGRGDVPFPRQVELDVEYIETRSLWLDVTLLARTVPAVLLGKGAY
jgi:lipopolysaccharide/colanic/teichoic acid biosynthesis glycosyltransferase